MNNVWLQLLVIFGSLVLVGNVLERPQANLTAELMEKKLVSKAVSQDDQLKIGQTGVAVALGGLRSLIAATMNLQAFNAYEDQNWSEVEELYDVIIVLQPNNSYYYENAGWHMAYNAYHDFEYKLDMSPARRDFKKGVYLKKGENYFLKGVEENPDSITLWRELGRLFNGNYKPYDFKKSAMYLKRVLECSGANSRDQRAYFYTLARVPGAEKEAYELGKELFKNKENHAFPSIRSLYFALSIINNPDLVDSDELIDEIFFGSKPLAYQDIVNYYLRTEREEFPVGQLALTIEKLAKDLNISDDLNPLKTKDMERINLQHK